MKKYVLLFLGIILLCNCSQEKTKTQIESIGEFPIMAWIGVPETEATVERFKELKESGVNINFSSYSSIEAVEKALDMAYKVGIKLMPSCPELISEPEKTAQRLMTHPALAGYHLMDEPCATDFPKLGAWVKQIQSVDKEHGCYINLFPNYANKEQLLGKDRALELGEDPYIKHVELFLKEVPVPFISFDHYPVIEHNGVRMLRKEWYKNLEIITAASNESGLPFWAFSLATAHKPYPIPTVSEIRLQMYSNLAYGAQTLQYFTYWHPGESTTWDFHSAPINLDGTRTIVYNRIKMVNQEIHSLSGVFLGSKLISVWHTGEQIPDGTRSIDELPNQIKSLETVDGRALVSVLKKEGRRFLIIVNRDFLESMTFTIKTEDTVKRVLKDATIIPVNNASEKVEIDPGDIAIFTWET